ncbi:MAG: selenoneine synthase SenA [Massilia sp.]
MTDPNAPFRTASPQQLAAALKSARDYTLRLFDCLDAAGFGAPQRVPRLAIVNPPLWELGHTAWFAEWFILRQAASSHPADAERPSLLARGDDWFDSNTVPHASRWSLDLPPPGALKTYCREVLDRALDMLARAAPDDAALYPYRLALAHEDMHGEASLYTMQTLGVAAPAGLSGARTRRAAAREIACAGGALVLGGDPHRGFVFDNEAPPATCRVAPFSVDAALVSNAQYLDFVEDGGYQYPQFWSEAGRAWLMRQERSAPRYWQRADGRWGALRFGRAIALAPDEPVRHVSLYEAQAWCAWAGRRLPLEAEWEYAASSGHPGFSWGELWEWTASPFAAHPGFAPGPYREYSAPWFGTHQVLRGASFATPARLRSPHFRNFYLPSRDDMFAGFRSCAM